MSEAARKTLADALSLPAKERLELAAELLDSVEGAVNPEWDAAWSLEIEGRLEAASDRAARGTRWTEARERIEARLRAK